MGRKHLNLMCEADNILHMIMITPVLQETVSKLTFSQLGNVLMDLFLIATTV